MTSVSYDVLKQLPQTALHNWHIFLPPIPSTSTWIKPVTLKLEAVQSCETLELITFSTQCKYQKYNHYNVFLFFFLTNILSDIFLFSNFHQFQHFTVLQFQAQHPFSHTHWRCKTSEGTVNWMTWIQSNHQHHSNTCMGTLKLLQNNHTSSSK